MPNLLLNVGSAVEAGSHRALPSLILKICKTGKSASDEVKKKSINKKWSEV